MYVWARLARMMLTTRRRGAYALGEATEFGYRCLPSDIDTYAHMNNARYVMLADLGRMDIFIRSGLFRLGR
jgi:hypothetical protein